MKAVYQDFHHIPNRYKVLMPDTEHNRVIAKLRGAMYTNMALTAGHTLLSFMTVEAVGKMPYLHANGKGGARVLCIAEPGLPDLMAHYPRQYGEAHSEEKFKGAYESWKMKELGYDGFEFDYVSISKFVEVRGAQEFQKAVHNDMS